MKKKPVKKGYFGQFYRKKEFSTIMKEMKITLPPHVKHFDKDGKDVDITKFGPDYVTLHRRQQLEREASMKKKPVKIPDCGWGMSTMLFKRTKKGITNVPESDYKKGHPGFKDVPGGMWEKIHKMPSEFDRTIKEVRADGIIRSIGLGISAVKLLHELHPDIWGSDRTKEVIRQMKVALKNITSK